MFMFLLITVVVIPGWQTIAFLPSLPYNYVFRFDIKSRCNFVNPGVSLIYALINDFDIFYIIILIAGAITPGILISLCRE